MNATTHSKRRMLLTTVVGVLAILGSLFMASPAEASENGLSGRVTLTDGTPLVGAEVRLDRVGLGTYVYPAATGTDGTYEFSDLPSGSFNAYVVKTDGITGHPVYLSPLPKVRVDLDGQQVTLDFVAELAGSIAGVVRGDGGTGLGAVEVSAYHYDDEGNVLEILDETTNSLGAYSFPRARPGWWEIIADDGSGSYAATSWQSVNPYYYGDLIDLAEGESRASIDFALARSGGIVGSLSGPGFGADDFASSSVELQVYDEYTSAWQPTGALAYVDSSGVFAFADLFPDSYRFQAEYWG